MRANDRLIERLAIVILITWLSFLAGIQFEKWISRNERQVMARIEREARR